VAVVSKGVIRLQPTHKATGIIVRVT